MMFAAYYAIGLIMMFIFIVIDAKKQRKGLRGDDCLCIMALGLIWPLVLTVGTIAMLGTLLNKWIEK